MEYGGNTAHYSIEMILYSNLVRLRWARLAECYFPTSPGMWTGLSGNGIPTS